MRYIITFLTLLAVPAFAQDSLGYLEGNNVKALLSNRGIFFNNDSLNRAAYEFPKGEGNYLIYSNAFWFGAMDVGGSVKMASELYGGTDIDGEPIRDIYPGAITDDGTAEAPEVPFADDVYIVSKEEILYHATNYNVWDYEAPYAITNWPAHGDVTLDLAENLAPFADLNGNGTYEPDLGEYPEIRGDHAAYIIVNDKGGVHTNSGGDPLGIEVHFMFYQYEDAGYLENTTFVNVRVINRGTNSYPEFVVGNYMDSDIGFSADDFAGYSAEHNMVFTYNADLIDEGAGGSPGYGENPPALGLVALNHTPAVLCTTGPEPLWVPVTAVDYWNLMTGAWTCIDEDGPSGDRRMFMASEPVSLNSGETLCYDYAIINSRVGTPIENVTELTEISDEVIAFHAAEPNIYCDFFVGLSEEVNGAFEVYPNPGNGNFAVTAEGNYDLSVFTMDGRLVYKQSNNADKTAVQLNVASGTYLLVIENETQQIAQKLVVE